MNKFLLSIIIPALMALASAAPSVGPVQSRAEELAAMRALPALEREEVRDQYGQFALRYVTAEGIVVSESGRLVPNLAGDDYVLITEGEVSYVGDDGKVYNMKFRSGIDGYHVEGNYLPTTPQPTISKELIEAPVALPEKPQPITNAQEAQPTTNA